MWTPDQCDEILNNFANQPGTATVIGAGADMGLGMLRDTAAESIADGVRDRAVARGITVEVRTQPAKGWPGYSHVIVQHIVEQGSFNWQKAAIKSPAGDHIAMAECDVDQLAFRITDLHGDAPNVGDPIWVFLEPPRPGYLGMTAWVTDKVGDIYRFSDPDEE